MKSIVFALSLISSTSAFACLGEAQLIAPILTYTKTLSSCKVFINTHEVTHFEENRTCPLSISEINEKGIEIGLVNGHECALGDDNQINGIIVKNAAGDLYLERK